MAKSLRSKREKRLRAIRREIVQPFYDTKEAAKLAAQVTALASTKVPVKASSSSSSVFAMETSPSNADASASISTMDIDMEGAQSKKSLKATGGVGKKIKRRLKIAKKKRKGKIGKKNI
ncbi:hypothetical protein Droror1_Dr00018065 [Drosera rotundifolia]